MCRRTRARRIGRDRRGAFRGEHDPLHAVRAHGRTDSRRAARSARDFARTWLARSAARNTQDQTMSVAHDQSTAALIALDWGTTALRAYLLDARGAVLDTRASSAGVQKFAGPRAGGGFDTVFDETCGTWLAANPQLPGVAAGLGGGGAG